jgi:O-antigen/teichoic acid export membrane protein
LQSQAETTIFFNLTQQHLKHLLLETVEGTLSLRLVVRGTAAMSSVNVLRILAQFIAIPILSRLLSPTDYGLVGIAMPFVLFAMMIADAGVGMSLVRTPAKDREEWSTCFWLSVLLAWYWQFLAPVSLLSQQCSSTNRP